MKSERKEGEPVAKVCDINCEEYKLGQRIREFRLLRGLTQDQLAELVGMERANISNYENGTKGQMKYGTLLKFSKALGVPVGVLLGEEEDELMQKIRLLNDDHRFVINNVTDGLLLKQGIRITA